MSLAEDMKIIKNAELDIELLNRDNEKKCAENNDEITKLENKIILTESILERELKKSGEDKLECKFDGYKGAISWQKMPDRWTYIDKVLMDFIISLPEKLHELFLKTTITIKKAEVKKQIFINNTKSFENNKITDIIRGLFLTDEKGRDYLVKGIEIEPQDPKFKYSIKKIKR